MGTATTGARATAVVNTVLGPIATDRLGVVAIHEALLSVVPGAQYAFDVTMDRAEIFATLARRLTEYRALGGGTIVDSTGMFHGRIEYPSPVRPMAIAQKRDSRASA